MFNRGVFPIRGDPTQVFRYEFLVVAILSAWIAWFTCPYAVMFVGGVFFLQRNRSAWCRCSPEEVGSLFTPPLQTKTSSDQPAPNTPDDRLLQDNPRAALSALSQRVSTLERAQQETERDRVVQEKWRRAFCWMFDVLCRGINRSGPEEDLADDGGAPPSGPDSGTDPTNGDAE